MSFIAHETAVIDEGADIRGGTRIWHWSHVCSGAYVGYNVTIGQNVFIGKNASVGDQCKIQNNVSIFDKVTLERGVFCGPSMVFTNVKNPRALIEKKNEFKATYVEEGVTFGANSTIVCGNNIGKYALISAGAVIVNDVKAYALMIGVPARHVGWVSEYGEKLNLPLTGNAVSYCKHTNEAYVLDGDYVTREA